MSMSKERIVEVGVLGSVEKVELKRDCAGEAMLGGCVDAAMGK